jgi:beta-lactamase regulating signal transducer with metallopeptidase domain/protein involved in polysaccharide export with SLBB domain
MIDQVVIERLGRVILHSLWQGLLVAGGLAGVLWLMRGGSTRGRHGVCCLALGVLVALPVGTFIWLGRSLDEGARGGTRAGDAPRFDDAHRRQAERPNVRAVFVGAVATDAGDAVGVEGRSPLAMIVVAWGVGVVVMGAWQVGGFLWLAWMVRRRTQEAGAELGAAIERMRGRMGVGRRVGIRRASWVQGPCLVGVLRPVVLAPVAVLNGLSMAQVESLIAHELAHVRRWDALVNLAQNLVRIVMFYHPAAWYVSRRIAEEREHCCDDAAAAACGDRLGYAKALLALEERRGLGAGLALGAMGGRRSLLGRVRRILGRAEGARGGRTGRSIAAAMVAAACVAVPLAAVRSSWAQEKKEGAGTKIETSKIAEAGASEVTPDDLKAEAVEYTVHPGDMLAVTIYDLAGPGIQTVKNSRVTDKGMISLPLIGSIKVQGLTEVQIEKAIAKEYRDRNLIANGIMSVTIVEARGNTFSVIGGGATRPGQYAITSPDLRVLDAMAVAGIDLTTGELFVLRSNKGKEGDDAKARKVRIPVDKLVAGESKYNVVIRRGDTLIAPGEAGRRVGRRTDVEKGPANAEGGQGELRIVQLVVGKDEITLDKKKMTWEQVDAELKEFTGAGNRVILEIRAASQDMTLREFEAVRRRALELVEKYGLARGNSLGTR